VHHILCGWSVYYQKLKGIKSSFEAAPEGQTTPYETIKKRNPSSPFPTGTISSGRGDAERRTHG